MSQCPGTHTPSQFYFPLSPASLGPSLPWPKPAFWSIPSTGAKVPIPHPFPQEPISLLSLERPPKIVGIGPFPSAHGPKFVHTGTPIETHRNGNHSMCRSIRHR